MVSDEDFSRTFGPITLVDYNDVPWYVAFEGGDPAPFPYQAPGAVWEGVGEGWYWSVLGGGYGQYTPYTNSRY